jgi:uncharacterized repeat protein (TIGR01451 family)
LYQVPLTNLALIDAKVSGVTCAPVIIGGTLPIGNTTICSGTHSVTQAEINLGAAIVNTASVKFTELTKSSNTVTVPIVQTASFTISKSVSPLGSVSAVGAQLQYAMTVTNTGNTDLTNFVFDDALVSFMCTLAQGATLNVQQSAQCSGTYTVTQNDFNTKSSIVNSAGATFTGLARRESNVVTTPLVRIIRYDVTKTGDLAASTQTGDIINYTVTIKNQGNADIAGMFVSDNLVPLVCTPSTTTLTVGLTISCVGSYVVTQANLNSGIDIVNVVTVTFPSLAPQSANFTTRVTGNPSVSIGKSANVASVNAAGQVWCL